MRLIDADRLLDRCIFYHLPNGRIAVPVIDVQHAPTVEPRPRWIPVTERLPEENLPVLVAVKQKDRLPKWVKEQTHSYVTDIDVYDDGGFYTHKNNVVAWMPLPEPYREDEQDD